MIERYKRSCELVHKYRTFELKGLVTMLKDTDIKHMKQVLKLKQLLKVIRKTEAL